MQHVKVTVLGDAELQPLNDSSDPDISHGKKNIAASCDNFVAHLAAAEAEARDDPESAPDRTEQGGDNAKEGQGALTLGTFGFPMVVIESSKDSGQESSENKDADNKSQSKSKTVCILYIQGYSYLCVCTDTITFLCLKGYQFITSGQKYH